MRSAIVTAVLVSCSCLDIVPVGDGVADTTTLELQVPHPPRLDEPCAGWSTLAASVAVLHVGGHDDCGLTLDANLDASGVCEDVVVSIIRPLAVSYFVPSTQSEPAIPWAFRVGWVDLTDEFGSDFSPAPELLSPSEGGDSYLLLSTEDVDDLPSEHSVSDSLADQAGSWARGLLSFKENWSLDLDDDGESNIEEICAGTLYD